jgi:dolichol-phosphate mannosyltransferase
LPSQSSSEEPASPELSIIIPTFNEIGNISDVIRRISFALAEVSWEIIFVDDDSPDGTAELVKNLARRDPRIRCLRRVNRRGLAGACIAGLLSSSAPYLAVMDADLQHDETILIEMLSLLRAGKVDLVIGSRHVGGGSTGAALSGFRAAISRWSAQVARFVLQTKVQDLMSGFFVIRRDRFDVMAHRLNTSGFKILADIIASTAVPLRISEVGYTFRKRVTGYSKVDARVALDFIALLVSKATRELIPVRFVLFGTVGAIGAMIHLLVLRSTMFALPEIKFVGAQTVATFVAMTSNFFVNNRITYREQKIRGTAIVRGLLLFYAVCALGAVANVGVASWIFDHTYVWWLAGLSGLIIGAVWNYTLSSLFIWSRRD